MPHYYYTIRTPDGRKNAGTIEASDLRTAAQRIRAGGGVITSLESVHVASATRRLAGMQIFGIPLKERVLFAVNLSVMVGSGLSIARALKNLAEQSKSKATHDIVRALHDDVVKGTSLSDAMAKHKEMFNELFVNMVRVGEVGGNLDESLTIIAHQLEKEQTLRARVRGAMMYPAIVLIAMIGIAVLMLTYILPQIMGVFDDMHVTLPASTLFIMKMSTGLRTHGVVIGIVILMLVSFFVLSLRTAIGRRVLSAVVVRIPVVKPMVIAVNCARFARIHSSLLKSGVSVVESLTIVRNTLRNTLYRDALQDAIDAVQRGESLADIIRKYPKIFPVMVPQMIDVGEETGKTGAMLLKIAEFYEAYVEQMTKNMSSIVEPLLMLVIGSGVGFFAVAMLKPMYSVLENIQ